MKGIIFTVLAEVVTEQHGPRVWDQLLDAAGIDGAYTSVGTYPDDELERLVAAAAERLGTDREDVLRWFGRHAIPRFRSRYPAIFRRHETTRSLLLSLNDVIHPQVRKLFPGAYAPEFDYQDVAERSLALEYQSTRMLCSFAEGLVLGAADHFGETVVVTHTSCARRGDEVCVLACEFPPAGGDEGAAP